MKPCPPQVEELHPPRILPQPLEGLETILFTVFVRQNFSQSAVAPQEHCFASSAPSAHPPSRPSARGNYCTVVALYMLLLLMNDFCLLVARLQHCLGPSRKQQIIQNGRPALTGHVVAICLLTDIKGTFRGKRHRHPDVEGVHRCRCMRVTAAVGAVTARACELQRLGDVGFAATLKCQRCLWSTPTQKSISPRFHHHQCRFSIFQLPRQITKAEHSGIRTHARRLAVSCLKLAP
ncbi:hypothetical protein O181_018435 [Austropuccinia psidii MF-1]|uniref:Uncharacterized protein n=1 Tax=Austropuccinia psidii MF-1 TaxID=1389203 RepID=A0A9Q3GU18_9BASI|nr:hypothetical protein [Austropuccinia psidii MF-1]